MVTSALRGYEDEVECKSYILPRDRWAFEKRGFEVSEANGGTVPQPLVVLTKGGGEEVTIDKINRSTIRTALDRLLVD